jgi:lambda repressor-like predicted transcriptional regulator|tara:strand:- start:8153 stop:8359 length:207 start_codon:yes stop_codon:yes gene_type:complete
MAAKKKYNYVIENIINNINNGLSLRATSRALNIPFHSLNAWLQRNYKIEEIQSAQYRAVPKEKSKTSA